MKFERVMWGVLLLFIGAVLLLENLDIIEFHWGNVIRFWPFFLIIAGVNILFGRGKSKTGGIVSIVVLVIMLGLLFFKGQQSPGNRGWIGDRIQEDIVSETEVMETLSFSHPYVKAENTATKLNIDGGGASFRLSGTTDSLFTANVSRRSGRFTLETIASDSVTTVNFGKRGNSKWKMGGGGEDIDFKLNTLPLWEMDLNIGAGEVKFDVSDFRVRRFSFDGGAAALELKVGSLVPVTDIHVKTGMANVNIMVPESSGCRIKTKTGLSAKDFSGFTKIADGTYQTANYQTSTQKIFINLDGGLSNFEVKRY